MRRLQAAGERPGISSLPIEPLPVSTAGSAPGRSDARRPQRRLGACCTLCSAQRCSPPPLLRSPTLTQAATAAADVEAICKVGAIVTKTADAVLLQL